MPDNLRVDHNFFIHTMRVLASESSMHAQVSVCMPEGWEVHTWQVV